MNKTEQEILDRTKERAGQTPFGYEIGVLVALLPYEKAESYFKDDIDVPQELWEEQTAEEKRFVNSGEIHGFIEEHMPLLVLQSKHSITDFLTTIDYYLAYMWLDGKEELADKVAVLFDPDRIIKQDTRDKICFLIAEGYMSDPGNLEKLVEEKKNELGITD